MGMAAGMMRRLPQAPQVAVLGLVGPRRQMAVVLMTLLMAAAGAASALILLGSPSAPRAQAASALSLVPAVGPCLLPVGGASHFGFVSFPSGSYVPATGAPRSEPATYSRGINKWLPANRRLISPASDRFAWDVNKDESLQIYSATGTTAELLSGRVLQAIGWDSGGIYFTEMNTGRLGILNPDTMATKFISRPQGYAGSGWDYVSQGHAYGIWGDGAGGLKLLDVNLSDGSATPLYSFRKDAKGRSSGEVIGDSSGQSILVDSPDGFGAPYSVVLVGGAGRLLQLASSATSNFTPESAFGDGNRIWLTSMDGSLWLFNQGSGIQRMTAPMDIHAVTGPCA